MPVSVSAYFDSARGRTFERLDERGYTFVKGG
jgi:hypothetical protein